LIFTVTSPLQLCIDISISSNSRNLLQFLEFSYTVQEKGGKPDRKPYPLPCGLKSPYRNLKSENSKKKYAQKPQRIGTFINSASGRIIKSNKLESACMLSHRAVMQSYCTCSRIYCQNFFVEGL
jgi:hypothetical protein